METKFQTSFIPKAPISGRESTAPKRPMGFFTFLSILIFVASLVAAGGAFGYLNFLKNQEKKDTSDLNKNIDSFEPQNIEKYEKLNTRMSAAKLLLSKHVAVTNVLDYLEEATLKTVQFNDFRFTLLDSGAVAINMNGQAKSYNSVAYQSQVFGRKRDLKNQIFSNLDKNEKGNVIFGFSASIDPAFVYYSKTLNPADSSSSAPTTNNDDTTVEALPAFRPATTTTPRLPATTTPRAL